MKKSSIYAMVGFVMVVCLPFSLSMADDQMIFVPDAGFEDHVLSNETDWIYLAESTLSAWNSVSGSGGAWIGWDYYGEWLAFNGNNKVYGDYEVGIDYIYQTLDEKFVEGETYTLSAWVGTGWTGYDDGWWLYFTGEDYTDNLIETSGKAPLTGPDIFSRFFLTI